MFASFTKKKEVNLPLVSASEVRVQDSLKNRLGGGEGANFEFGSIESPINGQDIRRATAQKANYCKLFKYKELLHVNDQNALFFLHLL